MKTICVIVGFLAIQFCTNSAAYANCIFSQILVGEIKVARIRIDDYNSLIVTSRKDVNGIHPRSIVAELPEVRWGYDVNLPNGDQIGQLNLDDAPRVPNPKLYEREATCSKNEISVAAAILLKAIPAKYLKKIW